LRFDKEIFKSPIYISAVRCELINQHAIKF